MSDIVDLIDDDSDCEYCESQASTRDVVIVKSDKAGCSRRVSFTSIGLPVDVDSADLVVRIRVDGLFSTRRVRKLL